MTDGLAAGVLQVREGYALLRREKSLWPLALAPVSLAVVAVAATSWGIVHYAAAIDSLIAAQLPTLQAETWYSWLWIGPGQALLWVARRLLFLCVAGVGVVSAFLCANVLAAPVLERLSGRVEELVLGECRESGRGVLQDTLGSLGNELRRLGLFATVSLLLALLGFVPGLQLLAPLAFALFTVFFLPLEYCGSALDRRGVPFGERRRWLARHPRSMLGFGGSAFATFLVPGLNFLMIPVLVVAGTLLVIRIGPERTSAGEENP